METLSGRTDSQAPPARGHTRTHLVSLGLLDGIQGDTHVYKLREKKVDDGTHFDISARDLCGKVVVAKDGQK